MARFTACLLMVLALSGCGGSGPREQATTTAYYLRDGKVAAARVDVPSSKAVARAALEALFRRPPDGFETELPQISDFDLSIGQGTAELSLSEDARLSKLARAEIVYTLTQFPTVKRVSLNGTPIGTRADYEDETPIILVELPAPGDRVVSPIDVRGTANTFEATLQLRLLQNGNELYEHFVTATSGTGQRGTFAWRVPFDAKGAATLEAFEYSAADGSEIHKVRIPIVLG